MLSWTGASQVQINDASCTPLNQHQPPANRASLPPGPGWSVLPLEMAKHGIIGQGDENQALVRIIVVFIRQWPVRGMLGAG